MLTAHVIKDAIKLELFDFGNKFLLVVYDATKATKSLMQKLYPRDRKRDADNLQSVYQRIIRRVLLVVLKCDLANHTPNLQYLRNSLDNLEPASTHLRVTDGLHMMDPKRTISLAQDSIDKCWQCTMTLKDEALPIDGHPAYGGCLHCSLCRCSNAGFPAWSNKKDRSLGNGHFTKGDDSCPIHKYDDLKARAFDLHRPLSATEAVLYVCMVHYSRFGQNSPSMSTDASCANGIT